MPITDIQQATPEWLTTVLRNKGCLDQGNVTEVRHISQAATTSSVCHLALTYSDAAPESAPSRLFLKILKPEFSSDFGRKEIEFYSNVADAMIDPPVVRCYDAVYSEETGGAHLLLDDVSETHFTVGNVKSDADTKRYCEQVMDCLAEFHAFWWDHPRLGKDIGTLLTEEGLINGIPGTERTVSGFVEYLGDRLSVERRRLYKKIISAQPALFKRLTRGKDLTLVHGDAHLWNFLCPGNPNKGKVCIIDWQFWHPSIASTDLAFMIALHWCPERRRLLEKDLIERYHNGLLEHGVANYNWDDCWNDYRLSVIIMDLFVPVWQWSLFGMSEDVWWSNLENAMLAFEDLGCAELLET